MTSQAPSKTWLAIRSTSGEAPVAKVVVGEIDALD